MTKPTHAQLIDRALFRIDWGRRSGEHEQALLEACARPTLPQIPAYAAALEDTGQAKMDLGILRFHDRPVGYVYVERRRLMARFSSFRIYRGPLWLDGALPGTVQTEFFRLLRTRFRLRQGKPLTFHPELPDTPANQDNLSASGFRRIAHGYATIWIDLSRPLDTLRAGLKQKWRNQLNQSERNQLELQVDDTGDHLEWLIDRHEAHMDANHYVGPSRKLLLGLQRHGRSEGLVRILVARHNGEPCAAILLTVHGNSATYFVGWNGPDGRTLRAHHFLLWQAITLLKKEGVTWFDLGGVNDAEAGNVAAFKAGLSGQRETLVGGYT